MMALVRSPLANIPKNPDTLLSYGITHGRDTAKVSLFVIIMPLFHTFHTAQKTKKKRKNAALAGLQSKNIDLQWQRQ
jgi:hypothetical protein